MPCMRRILHPSCTLREDSFQFQPRRTESPMRRLRFLEIPLKPDMYVLKIF